MNKQTISRGYFVAFGLLFVVLLGLIASSHTYSGIIPQWSWRVDKNDHFTYAMYQNYRYDDGTVIKNYGSFFRSDIVDIKDIDGDRDKETDLIILSSLLLGDMNFNVGVPITFDLYDLLQIINLVDNQSTSSLYRLQSALHVVSSQSFQALKEAFQRLPDPDTITLDVGNLPVFEEAEDVLAFVSQYVDLTQAQYRFNFDTIGTIPTDFEWASEDKSNNQLAIIDYKAVDPKTTHNRVIQFRENGNQYDPNTLRFDFINELVKKSIIPAYDSNIPYNMFMNISKIDFYYKIDTSHPSNELIINFTLPYDFIAYNGYYQRYQGHNGITLKITNDGQVYFMLGTTFWNPETSLDEPLPLGMQNVWIPITLVDGYTNIINCNLENFLHFSIELGDRGYSFAVEDIYNNKQDIMPFIPYYMTHKDIEFYLQNSEERYGFYPYNFHNLEISADSNVLSTTYFDDFNYLFENSFYFWDAGNTFKISNPYFSDLYEGLSFYNFLVFPYGFDVSPFAYPFKLVNRVLTMFGEYIGLPPITIFRIENTPSELRVTLTNELLHALIEIIASFAKGPDHNVYWELGEWNGNITMVWDRKSSLFQGIWGTIRYLDIGIIQEQGFKLVSTSMPNDPYPTDIPPEYSILTNIPQSLIDNFVNSFANGENEALNAYIKDQADKIKDEFLQTYQRTLLTYAVSIGIGSAVVSVGISELVRFVRKRE